MREFRSNALDDSGALVGEVGEGEHLTVAVFEAMVFVVGCLHCTLQRNVRDRHWAVERLIPVKTKTMEIP
jgi:hypothetical protein